MKKVVRVILQYCPFSHFEFQTSHSCCFNCSIFVIKKLHQQSTYKQCRVFFHLVNSSIPFSLYATSTGGDKPNQVAVSCISAICYFSFSSPPSYLWLHIFHHQSHQNIYYQNLHHLAHQKSCFEILLALCFAGKIIMGWVPSVFACFFAADRVNHILQT